VAHSVDNHPKLAVLFTALTVIAAILATLAALITG
jgi:hypothetical protein